ncbi:hypothetical protein BC833DRAFT_617248 [Globomyces pollinis-pini]|nr:hypothetical protein BC833DRAFT_617248 [Globomyces pollinis-pini]
MDGFNAAIDVMNEIHTLKLPVQWFDKDTSDYIPFSYFQQATNGDCKLSPTYFWWETDEKHRYQSWLKLRGITKQNARTEYLKNTIKVLSKLAKIPQSSIDQFVGCSPVKDSNQMLEESEKGTQERKGVQQNEFQSGQTSPEMINRSDLSPEFTQSTLGLISINESRSQSDPTLNDMKLVIESLKNRVESLEYFLRIVLRRRDTQNIIVHSLITSIGMISIPSQNIDNDSEASYRVDSKYLQNLLLESEELKLATIEVYHQPELKEFEEEDPHSIILKGSLPAKFDGDLILYLSELKTRISSFVSEVSIPTDVQISNPPDQFYDQLNQLKTESTALLDAYHKLSDLNISELHISRKQSELKTTFEELLQIQAQIIRLNTQLDVISSQYGTL